MGFPEILDLVLIVSVLSFNVVTSACSGENCQTVEQGCSACHVRWDFQNNSLPFNKYAFLTTHNAFSITGWSSRTGVPNVAPKNQEDSITQQLNVEWSSRINAGRVRFPRRCVVVPFLWRQMLRLYSFWDTLKEIEAFLSANPSEIITIILEDYVSAPKGLTKVFTDAGLMKYWFPVSNMPKNGGDWPLVSDMVANNQRLLVFTSVKSKEQSEGIAYQWNYMVENQYGDGGMKKGNCPNRGESPPLTDTTKSLVLVNFFGSVPLEPMACVQNSGPLIDMVGTCYLAAGNRWANFLAVDFYKRSEGGGTFQAVDKLNGELLCGKDDVHSCVVSHMS
nr:PI-PLC X domain-containing protein At5g67130 [Ipomoea trifida]GLL39145.1 PI-PLC X domain-containing protein At5g67130 [Ipomoea trifida]